VVAQVSKKTLRHQTSPPPVTRGRLKTWVCLAPSILFLTLVFVWPTVALLRRSLFDPSFTWEHYARIIHEPVYLEVLWITFKIATIVTVLTVFLGYPLAYAVYRMKGPLRLLLLSVVLLPFWTSLLVRTFAFILLLQQQGVLNRALVSLQIVKEPVAWVYNLPGVLIGMTYMLLPYMVLSLYSVMHRIDPMLEWSAMSLGAGRLRAFASTVLPLSVPGLVVGSSIVFLLSLGFFVTPTLLGGRREQMLSMVIEAQVNELLNWGFAAALSAILILATALLGSILFATGRLLSRHTTSFDEIL
jgi:putative spermidine/putrescine transport system permease protein